MGDTNFQVIQTRKLTLENISGGNVAFKVKTTALKAYLVRPSNAVLLPGETKEVSIMLQKQTERPKNYDHRFLVQAYSTTDTEVSTKEAWVALQRSSRLQEFRLSVVFPDTPVLMANQGGGSSGGDAGGGVSGDLKGKYDELVTYVEKLERQKPSQCLYIYHTFLSLFPEKVTSNNLFIFNSHLFILTCQRFLTITTVMM